MYYPFKCRGYEISPTLKLTNVGPTHHNSLTNERSYQKNYLILFIKQYYTCVCEDPKLSYYCYYYFFFGGVHSMR